MCEVFDAYTINNDYGDFHNVSIYDKVKVGIFEDLEIDLSLVFGEQA
jgi:hypothetical protein